MPRNHVAIDNDHISKLAEDNGFADWRTIWDDNSSLSSRRQNPNLLFKGDRTAPGDTVRIPDHDPGQAPIGTEVHHVFTADSDKLFLRLRILKDDFSALANASYELVVTGAPATFAGQTNGQGQLEHEIPRNATEGTLTVRVPSSNPGGGGGAVCGEAPVTWNLAIGKLNPIMENAPNKWCISGVQQRLNNLGISTGPIDGIKGRLTGEAIRTFQRLFELQVDGAPGQGETQPKLREAHDQPDSVLGPKDPPNDSQWAETPEDAIGHVCPDFDGREVFNTLRIRSSYRISLRLGEIEELFPHAPNTPEGRMERLQVLGMFYFPLRHGHARRAFDGIPASGTAAAVRGVWEHVKTRVFNNLDDAGADTEIQRLLREWVIRGGAIPPVAPDGTPPAAANFSKLMLPGGYSFVSTDSGGAMNVNHDASYTQLTFGRNMYLAENLYLRDNPILHKIPFIAKVEKFDLTTCEWAAAVDATVYFQLVDSYPLPAFDAAQPVTDQLNRPPLRSSTGGPPGAAASAGPDRMVSREENPSGGRAPDPADPQRGNAPEDRGGKQGHGNVGDGSDVANVIFSTTSRPGFNAAHSAPATGTVNPITRAVFFPLAERVNDAARKHSVKAKTNSEGEAGAIFQPSRCGGDRYRLRVFLGPPTVNGTGSDGEGASAVRVETGTFVTWRHLRMSRFLQQPASGVSAALLADVTAAAGIATDAQIQARYNNQSAANGYLQAVSVVDGVGTNVGLNNPSMFTTTAGGPPAFSNFPEQWAKAFIEFEVDRAAAGSIPEPMTQAQFDAARRIALADGLSQLAVWGLTIDLRRLLFMEGGAPAIAVGEAVCNIPMRTPETYNGMVAANRRITTAGANRVATVDNFILTVVIPGFLRALTHNGYTSGLSVVQSAMGHALQLYRRLDFSGIAIEYRGAFLWYGADTYVTAVAQPFAVRHNGNFPYDFTANVAHELGHVVYRNHAPGFDPGRSNAGGATASHHDVNTAADANLSVCVMSYQTCEGEFCGKCLLSFRGWNLTQIPA